MAAPEGLEGEALERAMFLCRRRIEKRVDEANLGDFYLCSFSAKTLIYKGMFRAELVDDFYLDLKDPRFHLVGRHFPPALLDQHLPRMAPGPALPDAGAQR